MTTPAPDPGEDARFAGYRGAQVLVEGLAPPSAHGETARDVIVRPAPVVEGTFPFTRPAHVITASDPGPHTLDAAGNAARHAHLVRELEPRPMWRTVASDGLGGYVEVGVLVTGLTDDDARAIGRRWGQDAIFRWDPEAWSVLACDGTRSSASGWSLSPARGTGVPPADPPGAGPGPHGPVPASPPHRKSGPPSSWSRWPGPSPT